jgi:hypothetical protein
MQQRWKQPQLLFGPQTWPWRVGEAVKFRMEEKKLTLAKALSLPSIDVDGPWSRARAGDSARD